MPRGPDSPNQNLFAIRRIHKQNRGWVLYTGKMDDFHKDGQVPWAAAAEVPPKGTHTAAMLEGSDRNLVQGLRGVGQSPVDTRQR